VPFKKLATALVGICVLQFEIVSIGDLSIVVPA
jgi:hypothetical protein